MSVRLLRQWGGGTQNCVRVQAWPPTRTIGCVPAMPKFSPMTVIVAPPVRRAKRGMLKFGACLAFSRATSIVSQLLWGWRRTLVNYSSLVHAAGSTHTWCTRMTSWLSPSQGNRVLGSVRNGEGFSEHVVTSPREEQHGNGTSPLRISTTTRLVAS